MTPIYFDPGSAPKGCTSVIDIAYDDKSIFKPATFNRGFIMSSKEAKVIRCNSPSKG